MSNTRDQKRLYIEHLGCAKNQVDAEVMLNVLAGEGYTSVEDASDADLILVNTCGFIESARKESIDTFFALKNAYPEAKIILTGCLSQRYAKELSDELIEADAIFGNRDLQEIAQVVREVNRGKRVVLTPSYPHITDEVDKRSHLFNYPGSAYLKISEGCNHRCRYCAIPLIRGSLRSRPMDNILSEAATLIAQGVKEINLIAQDLAAYGTDFGDNTSRFMELLKKMVALEGEFFIRLLYIHPDDFPPHLIDFVKENPKVLPYFDIPFQHAHKDVLRSMGRKGDSETYLSLIRSIRSRIPEATIRSTVMVGFTHESDETIASLISFLQEGEIDWVGSFVYSLEEGTPAYKDRTKKEYNSVMKKASKWQKMVEEVQQHITTTRLQSIVGTVQQVLIEELVDQEDLAIGRTAQQAPEVDGLTVIRGKNFIPGSLVECVITQVNGIDFEADPIDKGTYR